MLSLSGWEMLLFVGCPGVILVVAGVGYLVVRLAVKHGRQDADRNRPQ
ncbi:MAG: hypothetical protein ACK5ZG_08660 [Phycisphaerae bacterium]